MPTSHGWRARLPCPTLVWSSSRVLARPLATGSRGFRRYGPGRSRMITATDLELRAGARTLVAGANLRVAPGDRIGLVGRNGAGKTTSMRVLAGSAQPYGGSVTATSPVRYLPQAPRDGHPPVSP